MQAMAILLINSVKVRLRQTDSQERRGSNIGSDQGLSPWQVRTELMQLLPADLQTQHCHLFTGQTAIGADNVSITKDTQTIISEQKTDVLVLVKAQASINYHGSLMIFIEKISF